MTITINALDKDSSACHSMIIRVETKEQFTASLQDFGANVPFSRWYPDHENNDDDPEVQKWIDEVQ